MQMNENILITDMSPDTLQTKLSSVVKQLEIWFINNDLIINSSKTVDISFHLCHSIPNLNPTFYYKAMVSNIRL